MVSLLVRRFITGPIVRVVVHATGLVSREVGTPGGSEYATKPPNARLWLASVSDMRRREVKVMAERIGTDRLHLCFLGADVRIESARGSQHLVAPSTAVIGSLISQGDSGKLVVCDGSGLSGPAYFVAR